MGFQPNMILSRQSHQRWSNTPQRHGERGALLLDELPKNHCMPGATAVDEPLLWGGAFASHGAGMAYDPPSETLLMEAGRRFPKTEVEDLPED